MPLHMRTHPGPLPLDSHKLWHNHHNNQKAIPSERTGGSFTPRVVRGKHVSLELFALLGIFAHHENFLGGLPSGRVTADGTLFLFPLQSAIPSHIHDRNVSYHISIMCFRTEVGNGRGEDHHTDFSGERSGPSCPVRPVKNTAAERSPAARQGNLARRCPARGKTPGSFASTPAKHSQRERVRERRDARSEIPGKPVKLVKLRNPMSIELTILVTKTLFEGPSRALDPEIFVDPRSGCPLTKNKDVKSDAFLSTAAARHSFTKSSSSSDTESSP